MKESIDTLKRLYAIVFALAITEGLKRLLLNGLEPEVHIPYLPQFIALIFMVIPFVQGSNRHLDETAAKVVKEDKPRFLIILVLDFVVFLGQGCIFFFLAISIGTGMSFFKLLMVILIIDIIWALATYRVTKSAADDENSNLRNWALVNIATVVLALIWIYFFPQIEVAIKLWVLTSMIILRTVLDYWVAWEFYFPFRKKEEA